MRAPPCRTSPAAPVATRAAFRGALPDTRRHCMLSCMQSTSVRIDTSTHEELKRLALELNTTVGNTVALAVRALRQDRVGSDLTTPLRQEEITWLDGELG